MSSDSKYSDRSYFISSKQNYAFRHDSDVDSIFGHSSVNDAESNS